MGRKEKTLNASPAPSAQPTTSIISKRTYTRENLQQKQFIKSSSEQTSAIVNNSNNQYGNRNKNKIDNNFMNKNMVRNRSHLKTTKTN